MTREEAIKIIKSIKRFIYQPEWNAALNIAIKALQEPERKWIPVSERLPDIDINNPDQYVLISCWSKADNYFVQEALVYRDANDEICFDSLYWKDKVLAWMPLPEPYKAGE